MRRKSGYFPDRIPVPYTSAAVPKNKNKKGAFLLLYAYSKVDGKRDEIGISKSWFCTRRFLFCCSGNSQQPHSIPAEHLETGSQVGVCWRKMLRRTWVWPQNHPVMESIMRRTSHIVIHPRQTGTKEPSFCPPPAYSPSTQKSLRDHLSTSAVLSFCKKGKVSEYFFSYTKINICSTSFLFQKS